MDNRKLHDDLTDAFIMYQWRLENPWPSVEERKSHMIDRYRIDPIFKSKVDVMAAGVMHLVGKHLGG